MTADTENLHASPVLTENTDTTETQLETPEFANPANAEKTEKETPSADVSYEIPQPFLTLKQAAVVLGKSLRALERSLLGKWGNKLPDGWAARKMATDKGFEWRIIPPSGFRLRQSNRPLTNSGHVDRADISDLQLAAAALGINYPGDKRKPLWPAATAGIEQPSIIIDRSEEVEYLLRELLQSQKQLLEERRLRVEDLRLLSQMQSSMRLLEVRASETSDLKSDLKDAQQELRSLKDSYTELLNQPWWKRLFRRGQ